MGARQCSYPTHIVSISCLPSLSLPLVGSPWGRVEQDFNSGSQLLHLCCSPSCWSRVSLVFWLCRCSPGSSQHGAFRQGLSSQGKCSWTNLIWARQVSGRGESWGRSCPFVLCE